MLKIKTGLTGQTNGDILYGVMGQLSDGLWENSRRMETYWKNMDIVEDGGEWCIQVPDHFYVYWNMSNDEQEVKNWFANKIKQVVKEYIRYNGDAEWKRDCQTMIDYFHGNYSTRTWPTVADAYRAYDKLLGRRER